MSLLRRILDAQLRLAEKGKPLERLKPLFLAADTLFFEPGLRTQNSPHIRDAVDAKRWFILAVFALIPCICMAIWNTGVQKFIYLSESITLYHEFQLSCHSFFEYILFFIKDQRWQTVVVYGLQAFLPVVIISYAAGGLCEAFFAIMRGHEVIEGFLVSGMLFALILPPTIPYWLVAVGVIAGIIISKEVFGGTGMNIVNPAMFCRLFLFLFFPAYMSGNVWIGTNQIASQNSIAIMNQQAHVLQVDGVSQATPLAQFNAGLDIKRIHIEAIATHINSSYTSPLQEMLFRSFRTWNRHRIKQHTLAQSSDIFFKIQDSTLQQFVTDSTTQGGLGLALDKYDRAYEFAKLETGQRTTLTNWNLFLGNKLGSFGETSSCACLLGALFLIWTGVASWRTMIGVVVGTLGMSTIFFILPHFFTEEKQAWMPAALTFAPYKHLLLGGLAFGLVFMATDPVSSPAFALSKWIYGIIIGAITIIIRLFNSRYPEGIMFAVIIANNMAPLIDHYVGKRLRKREKNAKI